MDETQNPTGAGGAVEDAGGDFKNKATTSKPNRQAPRDCWLQMLDKAEERSRYARIEQRPKHRRLYKYLAARLARAVLAETGWR
jgi:hypothetical protein